MFLQVFRFTCLIALAFTIISPSSFAAGLYPISKDGKWGFVDDQGTEVVAPTYEGAGPLVNGRARYRHEGKWGFLDESGKVVIEAAYLQANDFHEDLAGVQFGYDWRIESFKWGYIDKDGKMVIEPKYDEALPFSEGLAPVMLREHLKIKGKYGYIDKTGQEKIKRIYDEAVPFKEGLARVKSKNEWIFINTNGEQTLDAAMIVVNSDQELVEELVKPGFLRTLVDGKWQYISKKNNRISKLPFKFAGSFSQGLAPIEISGLYGFINKSGKIAIKPQFQGVGEFKNDLAQVKIRAKWGFINKDGQIVIRPEYDHANSFAEDLSHVSFRGKGGFIDKTGKMIIKPTYQWTWNTTFENSVALVKKDGRALYINKDGGKIWGADAK